MSKVSRLSLKKNFSWNFIGSLVYSLSQFLILALLAKLGSPSMVGLYSLGLAITAPIINLTNLQLRQIQATDTKEVEYRFNDYFGLRIISGIIMLLITLLVVIINAYDLKKSLIILLVGLTKVMDSYSDVVYGHLQQRERMDYIGKSRIIKGISTIVVMGIVLALTANLTISLIALNVLWLVIFLVYDRRKLTLFLNNISPAFSYYKFKKLFLLAFPLGVVLMLNSLNTNLPRIIVEKLLGEAALGYFASVAYLLVAGNTFVQAVGQAAAPRLAKLYSEGYLKRFKKIIGYLILIGISIGLIGILIATFLGEFILTLLYDSSYAEYNNILILVMVAGIFSFTRSFLGYGLTAMRYFKIQPYINLLGFIVILISSLILIPIFDLTGAAYTLIVGSLVEFTLYYLVINYWLKRYYKNG